MTIAEKKPALRSAPPRTLETRPRRELDSTKPMTFPSIVELWSEIPPTHAARPVGLFEALLRTPEPLWQDATDDPTRYEPRAVMLLTDLMTGSKQLSTLTAEEQSLLDRATIDFAERPVKKETRSQPNGPPLISQKKPAPKPRKEKARKPSDRPPTQLRAIELPPFWWTRR